MTGDWTLRYFAREGNWLTYIRYKEKERNGRFREIDKKINNARGVYIRLVTMCLWSYDLTATLNLPMMTMWWWCSYTDILIIFTLLTFHISTSWSSKQLCHLGHNKPPVSTIYHDDDDVHKGCSFTGYLLSDKSRQQERRMRKTFSVSSSSTQSHICTNCGKSFRAAIGLFSHKRTHRGSADFTINTWPTSGMSWSSSYRMDERTVTYCTEKKSIHIGQICCNYLKT